MSICETLSFGRTPSSPCRVVAILGASGGIGRALVESYRGEDVSLYLVARNGRSRLAEFAEAAASNGDYSFLRVFHADLSAPTNASALADAMLDALARDFEPANRRFDELIFAAGVDLMAPDLRTLEFDARLALAWQVDVASTIHVARRIGNFMRDERRARSANSRDGGILFFSWDGVARGRTGETSAIYATCKGAIAAYARALAQELAPEVRVNTIAPGWIQTRWGASAPESIRARLRVDSLAQRWGEPREIASLARFLLSENASYVNGQTVDANGGYAYSGSNSQD